jgi:glycosyltransferase XagB
MLGRCRGREPAVRLEWGKFVAHTRLNPDRIKAKLMPGPRTSPVGTSVSPAGSEGDPDHWATWGAARDGARIVLTVLQKRTLFLVVLVGLTLFLLRPKDMLIALLTAITMLYVLTGIYKIWLLVRGDRANSLGGAIPAPAVGDDLPMYSVLVPLHREGRILPVLIERLRSINYPANRLEILLLIEMDDEETQRAVRECPLRANIRPVIMPPGLPRTKPRALNVGLNEARGDYLVIYDAEDQPESDQLRKAVAAFAALPHSVVCLQARLNFYNAAQSVLTRLFAVDYATWYDQLLPGLSYTERTHSGMFVPLGGTSNHLRIEVLRHLGGWDPFNVTEDCDLGARLGRAGLQVAMLDSVTWEEAVPHVRPWIKQRSRWIKGYIQSYLVHMRNPLQLLRQLGRRGFADFQMLVGSSSVVLLLNPLMWMLTILYAASAATPLAIFIQSLFPSPLYYPSLVCLTLGNFVFFYCNAYVCMRHDYISLTRYTLLTPFYWVLLSIGAWAGLFSLIRRPHYWAKTEHGVSLPQLDTPVTAESALR